MKIATFALACSLLGTAAFAQDETTSPAATAQSNRVITILVNGQPPVAMSLDGRLKDGAEFVFSAKKVIARENTMTLENGITLTIKKQGKILWSFSVPEGTVIFPIKISPSTQSPK